MAAPAAICSAIKDADIGLAIFASLGVTFPLMCYWEYRYIGK
ncbi:sodium-dependent bicarbonate transport family permease [Marinagarivorans cellulosilyticus]|nr:sodium-dependent bicarbonate transport family permease [Marinagarivorans cellulosilyticus]